MRPVSAFLSLSDSTFTSKILLVELHEKAYEHQRLRVVMNHVFKNEQEDHVPEFSKFVGQKLKLEVADLSLPGKEPGSKQTLFEGTVGTAELCYEPGGLQLQLQASSGSAGLGSVPKTRLFQETTLKELIDGILADYQGGSLNSTDVALGSLGNKKISFAAQWGETDWEFLLRLCRKYGLFMVARNRDLHIHLGSPFEALSGMSSPHDLTLGHDLLKFQLGLAGANRSTKVSTNQHFGEQGLSASKGEKSEDVKTWVGPSEDSPVTNALAQKVASGSSGGSPQGRVVEGDDHFTQQEFDAISGRWQNFATARMVRGEGESDVLGLGVGSLINIAPSGTRTFAAFEGSHFLICGGKHIVDDGVYSLSFDVNAEGAPPLLPPGGTGDEPDFRLLGATVTQSNDPNNLGRVKVRLNPFAADELTEDIPARCLTEASGDGHGTLNLPEIGDEVLVAFDPRAFSAPVVLGSAYTGVGKSLITNLPGHTEVSADQLEDNHLKYYLSKAGTCVVHDTTDGKARLMVATPQVSLVLSEEKGIDLHVRGSGGDVQITGNMDGVLTIKAKNINIEAEEAITFKSGTALEAEAGSDMKLKAGNNFEMEAAVQAKEKAGAGFEVDGGASLKLKAAIIDIN